MLGVIELTDTHCHIQSSGQAEGGEEHTRKLWERAGHPEPALLVSLASETGVKNLICVGCTLEDSRLAVDFVSSQEHCWASIGLHPHEAVRYAGDPEALERFAGLAERPKVVAIGETGLDYYYDHSPKPEQETVLRYQLELAAATNLPLIFHVREAFDDFWRIFDEYEGLRGVIHSYTAGPRELDRILERGLYVGINGIATFTKDEKQLETIKAIPVDRLLLETDAPYLTPAPFRGKICEPKHVRVTAEFLSGLRKERLEDLAASTTRNAAKLFGLYYT